MVNRFSFIVILGSLILLSNSTYSQFRFSVSTEQEYNDNPFHSPTKTNTLISTYDLGSELDLGSLQLGYYGSFLNFDVIPERNFYWHQFAVWKDFESSTLGVYAEQRINKEDYSYFNYSNVTAYYSSLFNLSDFYFSIAPNVSLTKYDNISILDNFKATVSYYANHGFESGTTLILGGGYNFKKYLTPTSSGYYSYLDEYNNIITGFYMDKNVNSISQIVTYGRVAQSISETTGLAAQMTNRTILNSISDKVKELNLFYGDESEIFDDPVNRNGNTLSFDLTQVINEDFVIKATYLVSRNYYPTQGLYDENQNYFTDILRSDNQSIFNLSLKKNFIVPLFSEESSLSVGINYRFINNTSNSYWFNYKNNSITVNLGLEF